MFLIENQEQRKVATSSFRQSIENINISVPFSNGPDRAGLSPGTDPPYKDPLKIVFSVIFSMKTTESMVDVLR